MSLGVLHNLSSQLATDWLGQTENKLGKTLTELSSGSRVNSGSDDAAGMSLIFGLRGSQNALTQTQSNIVEGVGILQVADGALSQVTNLLNRAVSLATEASNDTLNSSQSLAANQEYEAILDEISNIGATTSYNSAQVFGSSESIYMSDSSVAGTSIDELTISPLSSSSLGETKGVIAYSAAKAASSTSATPSYSDEGSASEPMSYDSLGNSIITLAFGDGSSSDTLTGSVTLNDGGTSYTFDANSTYGGYTVTDLTTLGEAIHATDSNLTLYDPHTNVITVTAANSSALTVTADSMVDPAQTSSSGEITGIASNATLSGSIAIDLGSAGSYTVQVNSTNGNTTGATLASSIANNTNSRVIASYDSSTGTLLLGTSFNAYPMSVDVSNLTSSTGTSSSATPATIRYSASSGENLSSTDLLTASNAQAALTKINAAIQDVNAQDGYLGSQINLLQSAGQVLTTVQQNLASAQDGVESTDYSSATAALSKYEVLSQTGITAVAQANQSQQAISKLLQ